MTVTPRTLIISFASLIVVAAVAIVLVLTLGGGAAPAASQSFTVKGTMYVSDCSSPGFGDLLPGAQVQVTSQDGKVLGVGELKRSFEVTPTQVLHPSDIVAICTSTFSVPNVPTGKDLYGIHIGNGNRGVIWKSAAEVQQGVALSIG